MKKLSVYAAALGATAVSMAFLGSGVAAAADDYTGQTYADASEAISKAGKKAVITTRAGDGLSDDNCVVTSSEDAPWLKGDDFSPVTDTVLVNLNCNAAVATATKSGNSAASPAGRAALKEAKETKEAKEAKSGQ
jgi:hypothetical protein